jgi:hypothetical protein
MAIENNLDEVARIDFMNPESRVINQHWNFDGEGYGNTGFRNKFSIE